MKTGLEQRLTNLRADFDEGFAQDLADSQHGNPEHLLVHVDRERFALPINRVLRLVRHADLTPLPGSPTHLLGVINLQGEIVAVYDLPAMFGYPPLREPGGEVVVMKGPGFNLGLSVTEIGRLVALGDYERSDPPANLPPGLRQMVRETAFAESNLVLFPDLDNLFIQLDARC
ncbi:MAG: chemotaxis protein CheW [Leptospirillia bacterium]